MDLIDYNQHNVLWKVSLSNGETFYENKGIFLCVKNEKSPWQKLLSYIEENKLEITSLSLETKFGQTFNLPSSGNNPKSKILSRVEKPIDYNVFRFVGTDIKVSGDNLSKQKVSDWFTVAEAIYPDYKLQIWVNELNTRNSWSVVLRQDGK